jgi:hypothetical protein
VKGRDLGRSNGHTFTGQVLLIGYPVDEAEPPRLLHREDTQAAREALEKAMATGRYRCIKIARVFEEHHGRVSH